ncbi:MAG: secondary thiamine-phosphate synthase enzyme YjbQ [Candidatus ainarchaeum sp.]|nr:secondary thiamine-phosphate synthase enzyme YjbQ [Candidatus ainarchaeum sp.]MDD5096775.1 secondary thiamine-phosphate synthase enzyme YjbQ [Candidatus ainarchaeum sp.]
MDSFRVRTSRKVEILDITSEVSRRLKPGSLRALFTPHTTAAITINEFGPGMKADYERFHSSIVKEKGWRHKSVESNAEAHLLSSLIKPSISIPIEGGSLALGTWQKILLVELDGPRTRTVGMQVIK